jgi:hypothetical protein
MFHDGLMERSYYFEKGTAPESYRRKEETALVG